MSVCLYILFLFFIFATISTIISFRCNVRTLWDLWWFGDTSLNIAPYRMIRSFDLTKPEYRVFLSKAAKVIKSLEALAVENSNINRLSIIDSRALFSTTFNALCLSFHPTFTLEQLDRRH